MIRPDVLKAHTIQAHGIQRYTQHVKYVIDIFHLADREKDEKIIQDDDEHHAIECPVQEVFIQHIIDEPVNCTESDPDICKIMRAYLEIIIYCCIAMIG